MLHGKHQADGRLHNKWFSRKKGFVLVELIVAVGIIAILAGIGIPSLISISNSLKNRQADDYAKAVYLAAQKTVTSQFIASPAAVRTDLKAGGTAGAADPVRYAVSGADDDFINSRLLPPGSVDETLRSKQYIIEYNAYTGEICAVYFLNKTADSVNHLSYPTASDLSNRQKTHLGYYSAVSSEFTLPDSYTSDFDEDENNRVLNYNNNGTNGDGELLIKIPVPDGANNRDFLNNLEIKLTVTGAVSQRSTTVTITKTSARVKASYEGLEWNGAPNAAVGILYTVDSVKDSGNSFANISVGKFQLGENVTFTATVKDRSGATSFNDPIEPLSDVSPLYKSVSGSAVEIENARNLQNLNSMSDNVAQKLGLTTVNLTSDITWYSGKDFVPLYLWSSFSHFNGNGNTVSGLNIAGSNRAYRSSVGLFSYLNAAVEDLTLNQVTLTYAASDRVTSIGAIAGTSSVNTAISDCDVTGLSLEIPAASSLACGGLVGTMDGGRIESCSVAGSVTNSGDASAAASAAGIGGAVGKSGREDSTARAVFSDVTSAVSLAGWGGTAGAVEEYPTEDPSGLGVSVGQFVGYAMRGTFTNCSASVSQNYHFLGKIMPVADIRPISADTYFYQLRRSVWNGAESITGGDAVSIISNTANPARNGFSSDFNRYEVELTACSFNWNGTTYNQVVDSKDLYDVATLELVSSLEKNKTYYFVSANGPYMLPASLFDGNLTPYQIDGKYLKENGDLRSTILMESGITGNKITWNGAETSGSTSGSLPLKSGSKYLNWFYSSMLRYPSTNITGTTSSSTGSLRSILGDFGYKLEGNEIAVFCTNLTDYQYLAIVGGQFRIYSTYAENMSSSYGYTKVGDSSTTLFRVYSGDSEPALDLCFSDYFIGAVLPE